MCLHFSSAEYPQSNSAAESAVKILKRLKLTSLNENELFRSILYLQNTTKTGKTASPAQLFLGRSARNPINPNTTRSKVSWEQHHQNHLCDQKLMVRKPGVMSTKEF